MVSGATLSKQLLSIPAVHEEGERAASSQRSRQILASSCDTKQRSSALFASTELTCHALLDDDRDDNSPDGISV
jgi:hypothetical protein